MVAAQVEKPATQEELARLLHEADAAGHAVVPVGGGRMSQMGGVLERCDVELHTSRLDRVIEHSPADMVVTVEAGITLETLQAELAKHNQFLPLDPFGAPGHTIGGILATGSNGPLRLRFGTARDFLIGIRVALPDGSLATAGGRVVKNVSGYDLMKLHHGALGTLGVITAASFKVFPKPLHDVTLESNDGWDGVDRALSLPLAPAALELFAGGKVVARFVGSPEAVNRMTADLGWSPAAESFWPKHSTETRMARIAAPRAKLHDVVDGLEGWWASPGVGVAYWSPPDAAAAAAVRARAEAAGGTLVSISLPPDIVREVGAWGSMPATLDTMRRIKDAFDPKRTLNPGRFVV
ncbi:MAG TPA: FAD-binding oxidoreductase [Candidatus Dormibacteraeota bacterium]